MNIAPIQVIGIMSGTSLDGIDLAACTFQRTDGIWSFRVDAAETISYSDEWTERLKHLHRASALSLTETHCSLGRLYGETARKFIEKNRLQPALIGSHGHTIFHQPQHGFTLQIGDGGQLAVTAGVDVICDFRSGDLALGGQGAPLVPIGDELLFGQYDACLNLGGIANISFNTGGKRVAWDICPVNMALNELAGRLGMAYDESGSIARSGTVNKELLERLNDLDFYRMPAPRSLGREWFEEAFLPLLDEAAYNTNDLLATVCEHISAMHAIALQPLPDVASVLTTGGGAFNDYLIERMRILSGHHIVVPTPEVVQFKEAIVFAFLAVLRRHNEVNILSSATGSNKNHIGGAYYKGQ